MVFRVCLDLGLLQSLDEFLIVQDVALGGEKEPEDSVLNILQLVAVGVDSHYQLVALFLQVWPLQTHNVAETAKAERDTLWYLLPCLGEAKMSLTSNGHLEMNYSVVRNKTLFHNYSYQQVEKSKSKMNIKVRQKWRPYLLT